MAASRVAPVWPALSTGNANTNGAVWSTVPASNPCTKFVGSPGMIHDRTPDCHPVSWAWMQPHSPELTTERSVDSSSTWVTDVLGISFCHIIHGCLFNQALADFRSTGAGIKCMYFKTPPLTAHRLSPLSGFVSRPRHVRKLPVTWYRQRSSPGTSVSSTTYNWLKESRISQNMA